MFVYVSNQSGSSRHFLWDIQFHCIVLEFHKYYNEKCTSHSSTIIVLNEVYNNVRHTLK